MKAASLAFLASAVACALVWVLSPWLTGHREPWDAPALYYFGALALAGFIAGALAPTPSWAHYLGAVAGQLLYEVLFLPVGPLLVLGAVFILGCSVVPFLAAVVSRRVRALVLGSVRT